MNQFEKLIEYIINDEDQKARELFHDIVVAKSRDIYESIMDEEGVSGDEIGGLSKEVGHDEMAMEEEEDDEFSMDADDDGEVSGDFPADEDSEMDADSMGDDDFEDHEEGDDEKIMNIDAKLDELLAKFDEIMGDNGPGEEMGDMDDMDDMDHSEPDADNMGGPSDHDADNMDDEESQDGMFEAKAKKGVNPFAKKDEKDDKKDAKKGKGSAEMMREYVDRIGDIYGGEGDASEGDAVGAAGKKSPINAKSFPGPGANFGGNVVKTKGEEGNPDGKPVPKPSNEYNKGQGVIKSGNVNVPGGKAGAPKSTGHEYTKDAGGAEGKTTDGTVPVAKKSVQVQNTGRK